MPLGDVLYESGGTPSHVYFPTTAVVLLTYVMESGASAEIAMVGNEGRFGVSLFMGGESTLSRAVVQIEGYGYRLTLRVIKEEFNRPALDPRQGTHRRPGAFCTSPKPDGKPTMKTDAQLQQDVIAELKWEPSVNAAQIGVEVKNGIVTLAGHVTSYAEKYEAEHAAQRVSGVKALAIEMDVKLAGSSKRTDADIASAVQNVLQWTTYLPKDHVKVMVEGGWVTLTGEVDWEYQRQSATTAVRYLMGVAGVSDQITIKKPKVSLSAVKSDIEAALKRRATADAQKISVEVDGANVTLTGKVHSWSERDLARNTAWGTAGVQNVNDKMIVAY